VLRGPDLPSVADAEGTSDMGGPLRGELDISKDAYAQACVNFGRIGAETVLATIAARHAKNEVASPGGMVSLHFEGSLRLDRTLFGMGTATACAVSDWRDEELFWPGGSRLRAGDGDLRSPNGSALALGDQQRYGHAMSRLADRYDPIELNDIVVMLNTDGPIDAANAAGVKEGHTPTMVPAPPGLSPQPRRRTDGRRFGWQASQTVLVDQSCRELGLTAPQMNGHRNRSMERGHDIGTATERMGNRLREAVNGQRDPDYCEQLS
jgi:hypothetical protein